MSNANRTVLNVEGMSCASCVRHVREALSKLEGVVSVEVELEAGLAHVVHDREAAKVSQMLAAIEGAGYAARLRDAG